MSKYLPLWEYIAGLGTEKAVMTYREIGEILGFPISHSFLNSKKELNGYGWAVKKISMKEETVLFEKLPLPVHDNISE